MKITRDKIKNAVNCAQQVLKQPEVYARDEGKLAISVDAVTDYISEHCSVNIEIREVVFDAVHLKGRKETYNDGRVIIEIRSNLSDFWKRFAALKELMHILVDKDEDDLTPYGDVILEKLVLEGHIGILSGNGDEAPAQSELVAEIAAIEVIYPVDRRHADRNALASEDSEITMSQLGLRYEAPGPIVSTALNEEYLTFIITALSREEDQAEPV